MTREELSHLLSIPVETRMDAENILFALEGDRDGLRTTTADLASSVLGEAKRLDNRFLFDLHVALCDLAENHGLLLEPDHEPGEFGLPFVHGYRVWHLKNAAANGKFDALSAPETRNYHDEDDEMISGAIAGVLAKALPAYAIPEELAFRRYDQPALDAQLYGIECEFFFSDLRFGLSFTLETGRFSFRILAEPEPTPAIQDIDLRCERSEPDDEGFASRWDPESADWERPLPLGDPERRAEGPARNGGVEQ